MTAPPIIVISLQRTPERLRAFTAENAGVAHWTVMDAVDGAGVDAAARAALGDIWLYTDGGVGSALSHMAAWRLCVQAGRPITVVEDDAVLRADFVARTTRLLADTPGFDFVLWGWNFDAVMEARAAPGVPMSVLGDQAALRAGIAAFRAEQGEVALLRLSKALGTPAYTISPAGAAKLLQHCTPIPPASLALPLMPYVLPHVTFDVAKNLAYPQIAAYVSVPPMVATRNDWSVSTIYDRSPVPAVAEGLAQARSLQAAGDLDGALAALRPLARLARADAEVLTLFATLLAERGALASAAAALERVRRDQPANPRAAYNLARIKLLQGQAEAALALLQPLASQAPDFALAHSNRGVALLALDRPTDAQAAFEAALLADPALAEASRGLAMASKASGERVRATGVRAEAQAWMRLGAAAEAAGDLAEAERCARLAAAGPEPAGALAALSNLLERQGRFEEALPPAQDAMRLDPTSLMACINLGVAHLRLDDPRAAEAAFRAALALDAGSADAHHGLAFALLKQERFAQAWPEYEWRLQTFQARSWTQGFPKPRWSGDLQPDATLLLAAEQGLGDTLMAATLVEALRPRVGRIVLRAPAAQAALLRRIRGVDAVVEAGAPLPPHDLWSPLMSLPGLLGIDSERVPSAIAALQPDVGRVAAWRDALPRQGVRIGVAWQGDPRVRVEPGRSFRLKDLTPLAAAPGVTLVSLQKGFGAEQLGEVGSADALDLGPRYQAGDLDDTAAIMASLDLVVSCDSAVAHLAGLLGRPVWIAVGVNPDWRWLGEGSSTIWYAAARLFRRRPGQSWRALFEAMALSLDRL